MNVSLDRVNDILELADKPADPFFGPASNQLLKAVASLAEISKYPDLLTCKVILELERLPERIDQSALPQSLKTSFGFLIASKNSARTSAALQGTAWNKIQRSLSEDVSRTELQERKADIERLLGLREESAGVLVP